MSIGDWCCFLRKYVDQHGNVDLAYVTTVCVTKNQMTYCIVLFSSITSGIPKHSFKLHNIPCRHIMHHPIRYHRDSFFVKNIFSPQFFCSFTKLTVYVEKHKNVQ